MNANIITMRLGLASAVLFASLGAATARDLYPANADQYYAQSPMSFSRQDHAKYDRSGTRGRQGLGAGPVHPEGPGNVSD